jgi:hypothetical protein
VFLLMAGTFILAGLAVIPIHEPAERRQAGPAVETD